jgi:hypothetical protein
MAEIKELWEKFRQTQENADERKRREFQNSVKGHCPIDEEKVNRYFETEALNHDQ